MLNPHRSAGESYHLLHGMGFWDSLGPDFNKWYGSCEACQRYRARPPGQAETDVAKKLFDNFKELHGIFSRMTAHEAQQKQDELNRKRSFRVFEKGETVFRRLPRFARPRSTF